MLPIRAEEVDLCKTANESVLKIYIQMHFENNF